MSDPSKTRAPVVAHARDMTIDPAVDLGAVSRFMTSHARLLERRRFAVRFEDGDPALALAAIEAYRNPDGGYGALEPDLRAVESQPVGAMHAFEVFEDVAPVTSPRAAALCDWLAAVSLPDGGLPFALPIGDATATAPFWAGADPDVSSLHITTAVAAVAQRVARHDPAVAAHPWLATATRFCLATMVAQGGPAHTLELLYGLRFLDALVGRTGAGEAGDVLAGWAGAVPADGTLPVEGGLADEVIRLLEFSPRRTHRCGSTSPTTSSPPTWTAWPRVSARTAGGTSTSGPTHLRPRSSGGATPPSRPSGCCGPTAGRVLSDAGWRDQFCSARRPVVRSTGPNRRPETRT